MPIDLAELTLPAHTAVLTMEIQRGVVGDLSTFPQLADAAAHVGVIPATARLISTARSLVVKVIHCTAEFRPDRAGTVVNCQLVAAALRNLGVTAVIVTGVSLILGVLGLAIVAVNLCEQGGVPHDAVAGLSAVYA